MGNLPGSTFLAGCTVQEHYTYTAMLHLVGTGTQGVSKEGTHSENLYYICTRLKSRINTSPDI